MLLPNTDADGCAEVGEEIAGRCAILAMLHAQSPPSRLVTASVGAATGLPSQTTTDSQRAGGGRRPRALRRQGQRPRPAGDVGTGRALAREERVTKSPACQA